LGGTWRLAPHWPGLMRTGSSGNAYLDTT